MDNGKEMSLRSDHCAESCQQLENLKYYHCHCLTVEKFIIADGDTWSEETFAARQLSKTTVQNFIWGSNKGNTRGGGGLNKWGNKSKLETFVQKIHTEKTSWWLEKTQQRLLSCLSQTRASFVLVHSLASPWQSHFPSQTNLWFPKGETALS